MAEIKVELRDFDNKILGSLDITSSDNFPLSLTYQNFDIRDFSSRNGSFSKTFKIPATKHNNVLLAHIYKDGNIDVKNTRADIPSTIYSDNVPIVSGTLKVTKILKNTDVLEYDCNFLGDNMDWASKIKNKDLNELTFTKTGGYIYDNVQGLSDNARDFSTFQSTQDTLHYPLMSVGEGDSPRNQVVDSDFVPSFYLKTIWDKIFAAEGYTVDSQFCNSDYFKSLIVPFEFQRQGEISNFKYGKIQRTSESSELGVLNYGNPTPAMPNPAPHVASTNLTVNGRTGRLTQLANGNIIQARFPFNGQLVIDDADVQADTLALQNSTGNVQKGSNTHASIDGSTMLVKNEAGTHAIDFNINFRHYKDDGSTNKTVKYIIVGELWQVNDDFDGALSISSDLTNGTYSFYNTVNLANQGTNPANNPIQRLWREESDLIASTGHHDSTYNFSTSQDGAVIVTGNEVGVKYMFTAAIKMVEYGSYDSGKVRFSWKSGTMEIKGSDTIEIGEDLGDIQYFIPKGKQSDFVSGVSQMFNLQFKTDSASKIVKVEPYDYFYKKFSDSVDWTSKIDFSKTIQDEFIHDIKSEIVVKYKDASSDAFLERFNKKNETDWGAYRELDTQGIFADGNYTVENKYFSPSFNWYEIDYVDQDAGHSSSRRPFIPIYHSKYSNIEANRNAIRAEKDFGIGARVLITVPVDSGTERYMSSQSGQITGYSTHTQGDITTSNTFQFDFCRANFFHLDNAQNLSTGSDQFGEFVKLNAGTYNGTALLLDPNLSFNDVKYLDAQNSGNTSTLTGLFKSFYSKMVNQLKQKPRIKSIYINLNQNDIALFDFQRLVFLDGIYYRVNKIVDFKPHLKQSTKVELVEYFDLGLESNTGETMNLGQVLNL